MGIVAIKGEHVSNPWREAIEVGIDERIKEVEKVSNPWREAIEACTTVQTFQKLLCFQSLEGGY